MYMGVFLYFTHLCPCEDDREPVSYGLQCLAKKKQKKNVKKK